MRLVAACTMGLDALADYTRIALAGEMDLTS